MFIFSISYGPDKSYPGARMDGRTHARTHAQTLNQNSDGFFKLSQADSTKMNECQYLSFYKQNSALYINMMLIKISKVTPFFLIV